MDCFTSARLAAGLGPGLPLLAQWVSPARSRWWPPLQAGRRGARRLCVRERQADGGGELDKPAHVLELLAAVHALRVFKHSGHLLG